MRAPAKTIARAQNLRRAMSLPEVLLWRDLRRFAPGGLRVRRQHPIGPYILDFYVPAAKLAIEIDGAAHDIAAQVTRDRNRDTWLAARDIDILRINASDVLNPERRDDVLATIAARAQRRS